MNEEVENMVRRALEDEAESYRPTGWAQGSEAVREEIAVRRRRRRNSVAVSLAVAGTAAAAVLGVVLAQAPRSSAAGPAAAGTSARPFASGSATASRSGASAGASASATAITWPEVRIVQPGQTVVFEHQIWMRLTASGRCEGMDLPHGGFGCNSATDGNQPKGTVGLQGGGDTHGEDLSPLYVGAGDVARMTITYRGVTYPVTVVKLPGNPGYATGYLWLPNSRATTQVNGGSPADSPATESEVTVYDASGKVLATRAPIHMGALNPSGSPSTQAH